MSDATDQAGSLAKHGHPRPRKIKLYDFKRPDKFSMDQIRTVAFMHETFARLITTGLSSMLRSIAHVREVSVDQLTYEEFIRSIPDPTMIAVLSMEPLKGPAVLEIDPAIAFSMIDRLFGGKGAHGGLRRDFTDIELSTLKGGIPRLLGCLRTAWASIIDVTPALRAVETRPAFAQAVPPREMIVLVTFEAAVGDSTGMINLAIPYLTIEPVIPKLSAQYIYSRARTRSPHFAGATSLPVTVEVCYEGQRLSLAAVSRLRRGALVAIPSFSEHDAFLRAGGSTIMKLTARPAARRRTAYAVENPGAVWDLQALRAARDAEARKDADSLPEAIRSFASDVGSALKRVEERMGELGRRQEEISDHLLLRGAAHEAPSGERADDRRRPFGSYTITDCEALAAFLSQEHPQLIAMVLSYLEPGIAACILERIPGEEVRADITERICAIERIAPEVVRLVEDTLEKKLSAVTSEESAPTGGVASIVEILNLGSRGLEKGIVETLEKKSPALAEEIKKRMFVFEDIVLLDRPTLGLVFRDAAREDVLLSIKACPNEIRDLIWESLPQSEVDALKARFGAMGSARLVDVDAAQQRIVGLIRRLDEEGRIVVARPGETVE